MREELEKAKLRSRERMFHEIARRLCLRQTVVEIARELNRPVHTLYRWMRSEQFELILKGMDERVYDNVVDELGDTATQSVYANAAEDIKDAYEVLRDLAKDGKASGAVRRSAANDILEIHGLRQPRPEAGSQVQILTQVQIHNLKETMEQVVDFNDAASAKDGSRSVQLEN